MPQGGFRISFGAKRNGVAAFDRQLGLAKDIIGSLKETFEDVVHPYVLDHVKAMFRTQGSHGGASWAGYRQEPKYAAYKASVLDLADPTDRLMRWAPDNERLYPSLVAPSHPQHIFQASDDSVRIGTSVPYAKRLATGGTGPFGEPFPGRPMFAMTRSQKSQLVTEVQRDITRRLGAARLRRARNVFQARNNI